MKAFIQAYKSASKIAAKGGLGSKVNPSEPELENAFNYLHVFDEIPVYKNSDWYFEDASGNGNDVLVKNQRVGFFSGVNMVTSNFKIPGKNSLNIRFIIIPTSVETTQTIMLSAASSAQKGINVRIISSKLTISIRDGSGSTSDHVFATLANDALYDCIVDWDGIINHDISVTINGSVQNVTAKREWEGDSTSSVLVGANSAGFIGKMAYFTVNQLFEYIFNHNLIPAVINILDPTNNGGISNFTSDFWSLTFNAVEPYQLTRGVTIYRSRNTFDLFYVAGNITPTTILISSITYNRVGYYANGIFYGLPNIYVIPTHSELNAIIPAGEYTYGELRAYNTAGKIDKIEDYYSISLFKAHNRFTQHSEIITIPGGVSEKENFILLNLHKNYALWDKKLNDVFFCGSCQNNFADIRVYDESENILPVKILSYGNYDIHTDRAAGEIVLLSDGRIVSSNVLGQIVISGNDGKSFVLTGLTGSTKFVTLADTLIFLNGFKVYRATSPYSSATEVMDFTAASGVFLHKTIVQFSTGEILLGRYQTAYDVKIYKSIDDGATWSECYSNATVQHVHNLLIDESQTPSVIYGGLDAALFVIKSTDKGETWTTISPEHCMDYGVIYSDNEFRLIGGETAIDGGYSIQKTVDDSTFYPVLSFGNGFYNVVKYGDILFAFFVSSSNSENTGILKSVDDGETWEIIWISRPFNISGASDGYRIASELITPLLAPTKSIIVHNQGGTYSTLRVVSGGSDYSALAIVKVTVPVAGTTIRVKSNAFDTVGELDTVIDPVFAESIIEIKFNEGTGNTAKEGITDTDLTITNHSWVDGVKRLYNFYPPVQGTTEIKAIKLAANSAISPVSIDLTGGNFTLSFWTDIAANTDLSSIFSFGDTLLHGLQIDNGVAIKQNGVTIFTTIVNAFAAKLFTITVDASGNAILYVNGGGTRSKYTGAAVIDITRFTGNCYFFANHFAISGLVNFQHPVQGLKIINRILTEEEISDMYGGLIKDLY